MQVTPWDWMWTLTMCCFRLKLFEKVFQQYSQTRGCIHLHRFRGCVAWEVFVVAVSEFEPSPSWFGNDAWIFSICWAETGRKLETVFIHNFYLSAREPSRPCPASSVLVQDDGEMMVEMDLNVFFWHSLCTIFFEVSFQLMLVFVLALSVYSCEVLE